MAEAIAALAAFGHHSEVVLPQKGPMELRLNNMVRVHVCHHNQWITSSSARVPTARWLAYNRRVAEPLIARIARDMSAEVLISNTTGVAAGGFAARRIGRPHIWFLHELNSPQYGMRFLLGRPLTMWLMRRLAVNVVAVSNAVRDAFRAELPMEDAVSWMPTSLSAPDRLPPLSRSGALKLVSVGAWIPGKDQSDAIDAVEILHRAGVEARLELLGGCETWYRGELERRAERDGVADKVTFTTFQDDPTPAYLRADAAVMCSAEEGLGRGAIEALKLGRPVVAAAGGGLLDVVRDGRNGLLYNPGDPEDLARVLRQLASDRDLLRRLGDFGRRDAWERFTAERMGRVMHQALIRAAG
jgi:glycosyltransferase involved in cell wall biosynthesis